MNVVMRFWLCIMEIKCIIMLVFFIYVVKIFLLVRVVWMKDEKLVNRLLLFFVKCVVRRLWWSNLMVLVIFCLLLDDMLMLNFIFVMFCVFM